MADMTNEPQLVVGLGASAGGIQAVSTFLAQVKADAPFAYVVILHLLPEHESNLAQVLQTSTSLPTTQVQGPTIIERGHVYVIPPTVALRSADGCLVLTPMMRTDGRKAPIDLFFRSLADSYGTRAVAVVLSGTGADGSNGLKRVKEYGGLTIAQVPSEAVHDAMPTNAIATKLVDYVLPAAEMPSRIAAYAERRGSALAQTGPASADVDDLDSMRELMTILRTRTGHDFSNYKSATVKRRIERRMAVAGAGSLAEYTRLLREHHDEAAALMKELLISVTSFFRDADAFSMLEAQVVPRLFEGKTGADQVRVWSAGCATGEEPYSLAMLLLERAARIADPPAIQVFATDLDDDAIATAREGLYTEGDVLDVSPARLQRFFAHEAGGYRVRRELREVVLFAAHNVIRDPPFSHLDLIACRNLLIYLNRTIQARVVETFHCALRPGGTLFLGPSESPDSRSDLFVARDKNAHFYQSRPVTGRLPVPMMERALPHPTTLPRPLDTRLSDRVSPGELHLRLLEQFAPPSVVITDDHLVVHMSDHAARFFQAAGGEPSRDILKLVHPSLRADLRQALLLASRERKPITVQDARMERDHGALVVNLTVKPVLREDAEARGYLVILFEEAGVAPPAPPAHLVSSPAPVDSRELEEELARVREQLRITVEQYETQVEEAKASNEELQSMHEELRSTTEELETSNEELQSINEELTTVNHELKLKVDQLGLTNNDFQNLISSADIGAIFVDKGTHVKLTTPRARDLFNLLPSDIGRKLSDITTRFEYAELQQDIQKVLQHLQTVEREVSTPESRWYLLRLVPYRTLDDRIDGVALAFQDITSRHQAEQQLRESEERLRILVDSAVDYAMYTLSPHGVIDSWNAGAERLYGYTASEVIGQSHELLFTADDRAVAMPARVLEAAGATGRSSADRWQAKKDGTTFYANRVTFVLAGPRQGFATIARDLTAQRDADRAVERARGELEHRVHERTIALQAEVTQRASAQERVTALLRRVVTAQEDERARVSRELHDQLGQQLTALRLTLDRHRSACALAATSDDIDRALAATGEIDRVVDFLAWELRPAILDHLGLASALRRFLDEWSSRYGITTKFEAVGMDKGRLSPETEIAFYRVAQEALNNVAKHAHPTHVDVVLESRDTWAVMVIEDDGVGFDATEQVILDKGIGILGMRERAALIGATLDIESSPGNGTAIYLRCPMPARAQERA